MGKGVGIDRADLREPRTLPELGEGLKQVAAVGFLASQEIIGNLVAAFAFQNDANGTGQDEESRVAIIAAAHDQIPAAKLVDAGIVLEDAV